MTRKQRAGLWLINAYLAHHSMRNLLREMNSWIFLLAWAEAGGKTRDVPVSFGGTA